MRARDLIRYCRDLGWRDPPDPPVAAEQTDAAASPAARAEHVDGLNELARSLHSCRRCRLSEKRQHVVFGEGNPEAALMFIGEGPGAEEDRTGRPFVGQAGQLLDAMIRALGMQRSHVYIANVVKCRPPGNRAPQEEEMAACAAFLDQQIELIRPAVIVSLGRPAAQRLTGSTMSMGGLHGRWTSYRGVPVLPTYHPAYLLRNPLDKRLVWQDLKMVRSKLRQLETN